MKGILRAEDLTDEIDDLWGELLDLVHRRPAWHADALCREHPEVSWFPEQGQSSRPAKDVCASCLVAPECRAWAMAQGPELQGVFGGLSQRQRRGLRPPGATRRRTAA